MKKIQFGAYALAIGVSLIIFSPEAHVSRIFYKQVSLEDILLVTKHVVVVRADVPDASQVSIPIHGNSKKFPAYTLTWLHYQVVEVLHSDKLKVGDKIRVMPGNELRKLSLHKKYHLQGISKSPIYRVYECETCPKTDESFIIFINNSKDEYIFTVGKSLEGLDSKEKVIKLIQKK